MSSLELGVKVFAAAREALGVDTVSVSLGAGARVSDLLDALAVAYPDIARLRPSLAVAVNHEIARSERTLIAGDEVALIPPVGGG